MARVTKAAALTSASVKGAIKAARAGEAYVRTDAVAPGLELRVGPRGAFWGLRLRGGDGRRYRWNLGVAVEGDADAGATALCLESARRRAVAARECLRRGGDVDALLRELAGLPELPHAEPAAVDPRDDWTWEAARDRYLDDVRRTRRLATYDDYRTTLGLPDFSPLSGRRVADVTRHDVARVIAAIHARGAESQSEHALRVVRAFWTWLADDSRSQETGVLPGVLSKMKAPERTRVERGDVMSRGDEEEDDAGEIPSEMSLGRALAIFRSGAMPLRHSLLAQVLMASAQRRRTMASAHMRDFRTVSGDEIWSIPPANRKTARKRRSQMSHIVPLVGWGAEAARRLWVMASDDDKEGWLAPSAPRGRRAGKKPRIPHADPDFITEILNATGCGFTPHGVRRAFSSYGVRDLGFRRDEPAIILDHLEGVASGNVTAEFYSLDPELRRKREMIAAWTAWLDARCADAIAADQTLVDIEAVREIVYRSRYGDEKWEAKLARVRKRGGRVFDDVVEAAA
jgi:hypothetical protein